ncbi:MAG: hypothetical protein JWN53_388 [Gemmatimonadetes bacterium]|jgi:hypothetical protein|nr:hypothetical protein [Gemmatimonadota bacterium]
MRPLSRATLAAVLLALPLAARAQGALSTQGFGYPGGQMSARTLGTGGALAEIDPLSATNPSSIFGFGGSALYFQAEPEYRTLHVGSSKETTTIARYPLVSAGVPLTQSLFAGVTVSSLLDRSFITATNGSQVVGDSTVTSRNSFSSDGSIGDIRLALAWSARDWLVLGVGGHVITGDNRLNSTQVFDDSTRFARLVDTSTVSYVGSAYSAGFQLRTPGSIAIAGSYRYGKSLSLKHGDTTKTSARVPDRLALGVSYLGIRGTSLSVRTAKDNWSSMAPLFTSSTGRATDSWDTSVGADVPGPNFLGNPLQLRAGGRWRTLPFGVPDRFVGTTFVSGGDVKENSYSLGAGSLLARGRAAVDITAIHASRSSIATTATETAWTLSIGITVRP